MGRNVTGVHHHCAAMSDDYADQFGRDNVGQKHTGSRDGPVVGEGQGIGDALARHDLDGIHVLRDSHVDEIGLVRAQVDQRRRTVAIVRLRVIHEARLIVQVPRQTLARVSVLVQVGCVQWDGEIVPGIDGGGGVLQPQVAACSVHKQRVSETRFAPVAPGDDVVGREEGVAGSGDAGPIALELEVAQVGLVGRIAVQDTVDQRGVAVGGIVDGAAPVAGAHGVPVEGDVGQRGIAVVGVVQSAAHQAAVAVEDSVCQREVALQVVCTAALEIGAVPEEGHIDAQRVALVVEHPAALVARCVVLQGHVHQGGIAALVVHAGTHAAGIVVLAAHMPHGKVAADVADAAAGLMLDLGAVGPSARDCEAV